MVLDGFEERKEIIRNRISEFQGFDRSNKAKVFEELAFCLMTPQSKASAADLAVKFMTGKGLLFTGGAQELAVVLQRCGVRFPNNKAQYIVEARGKDLVLDREWLVSNVKGLGLKEASHFLRNIGVFGHAILDRHVLKNLVRLGVISEVPALSRKNYFAIEQKFKDYASSQGLSVEELDLLFWSLEAGRVFK